MTLQAGTAAIDITPPAGSLMAAFPRGKERVPRRAQGVLDPLMARALALHDDNTCVVLCSLDTCILRAESVRRIRDNIRQHRPDIPADHVLISVSHTHSGAETSFRFGGTPDDPMLLDIESRIEEAVLAAYDDMSPATFSWGRTPLPLNHNRRVLDEKGQAGMSLEHVEGRTTGPVDPDLTALCFTRPDGTAKAVLYHYTAHALTLGPANDDYSADYPGRASRLLEETIPGCTALFLNGAAGNVHPRQCMRGDTEALELIGRAVGEATLEVLRKAQAVDNADLALGSDRIEFVSRADPAFRVPVEIDVLRLGLVILGFVPGEFFVEFQLRFKQAIAPCPGTLVGYSNGGPGYVPTRESYAEGGYGVEPATIDAPRHSRTSLPEGAGETILQRLTEIALDMRPSE